MGVLITAAAGTLMMSITFNPGSCRFKILHTFTLKIITIHNAHSELHNADTELSQFTH